jgi:type IX secretion system PorP/SprF family membrane protein
MIKYIPILLLLTLSSVYKAQDVHLSQFYTNAANLNPALVGHYKGAYQFTGNYRNQWHEIGKPLNTFFLAADKKMFLFRDEIDVGILLCEDKFQGFNQKVNKILIHGAYKKNISGHIVSGGIQLGGIFRSTDLTMQTFPNQWVYETGEFSQDVNSGELNLAESQGFFDATIGVAWSKIFPKWTPTVGFSLSHFNRPKDTYFNVFTERLRSRKSISAKVSYHWKNDIYIEPQLLYMWTTKAEDLLGGFLVRKNFPAKKVNEVNLGLLFRTGFNRNRDAIIPTIGFGFDKVDVGISYDINISTLSRLNSRKSTFELSLIYTVPNYEPKKLSIPCDRY